MRENGRSERLKSSADAQPCLSDVYKNGTRAKRRQADAPLCGRSMVEMLGVLAIIGVLSVGAMSGYSKAMLKYKLNKQAEAMTILLNNAMHLRPPLKQNSSPNDENYSIVYTELLHKLNLLPDGIRLSANNNKYMEDMFDNFILFFSQSSYYAIGYIFIDSSGRYGDRANRLEICRNIIHVFKSNSALLRSFYTDRKFSSEDSDGTQSATSEIFIGDTYHEKGTYKRISDITLNDIDNLCNQCKDNSTECRFWASWY